MNLRQVANTTGRRVPIAPTRDDLIDAAFLSILMLLALVGFRTTFSGDGYLLTGVVGLVVGLVLAHLANSLRQPMIAVGAMTVAVFFLLGGAVALRGSSVGGTLPTGSTLHVLADQSVHGWKDLLTTLPPVDGSGPLLVLPYIIGLLGGVGGFCLARRARQAAAPLAAPFLVLVLIILLGSQAPAAQLLQGGLFGVVALGWVALRAQRERPPAPNGVGRWMRLGTVAALLGVAAGAAIVIGPHVPGNGAHKRLVLRNYVDPPFDIGQYASPLAAFRRYTKPAKTDYLRTLFTVHGLPAHIPVRIATLDDYNGITWTASNQAPVAGQVPDTFQRVGSDIADSSVGRSVSFRVAMAGEPQNSVWLPDVGSLTRIDFGGPHAGDHADYFRYNLATGTGVVPDTWRAGDTYTARAIVPTDPDLRPSDSVQTGGTTVADSGSFLRTQADEWASSSNGATAQIFKLADHLRSVGRYTDGEPPNQLYLPGHYRKRLLDFVGGAQVAGDDEQFAAAFALMINQIGTPARVVFGAAPEADGVVKGKDVQAWVEVQLVSGSWRAIPRDTFMDRHRKPAKLPPQHQQQSSGKLVPPPARGRPHSDLDDSADAASRTVSKAHAGDHHDGSGGIPAWVITTAKWVGSPLLVVALVCGLVIGAKALRRRRRRTRGTPANRFARGWREIVDHAQDLGERLPSGTRKEQALVLRAHDARSLARSADAFVFGPVDPSDGDAATFWTEIDSARRAMSSTVGRGRRLRAALSLSTFRPVRGSGT